MARGITMYGNKGPVDSETRRQTDPNLRARAGSGNVVTQTPRKLTDAEILAGFMRQGMGQIDRAVEGMNISFPTGMAGGGQKASDILAAQKFEYEKAQDRAAAERQARTLAAYQNMLSSGGYRTGTDQILGMIGAEGTRSQAAVEDAYKRALQNIAAGYETAQGLTTQGYGALEQFLRANPNNPYANVQVSAPEAPDAMQQILSAYGVAAEPVLAQVAAEQAAAKQGAAGFQNLLSTLGGAAQQADLSRLAEMEMARTLAGQTLGTQRATFSSQAEQARANALAEIEAQLAQARIQQEAAAIARRQQIEDAIAAAGGTIGGAGAGSGAGAGAGGETEEDKRRREALAQMLAAASSLGAGTGANMGPLAYAI